MSSGSVRSYAGGTMLHKGNIFITDTNSGIWSVRLQPPEPRTIIP